MFFKRLVFLFGFLMLFCSTFGTHIVGGEITYRYLDSGKYRITLRYFIDCINGNPQAIAQDTTANFGFFNAKTNQLIDVVSVYRSAPNRIKELHYKCIKFNNDACVDEYIYEFDKTIDPGDSGIIISYQRCCRNHTISNLIDPGSTGNTFIVIIPPRTETPVNSSPFFNKLPPNFLCTNAPLIFDHSATDPDGDSLVYSIIVPYKGATTSVPRPTQPSDPPYALVTMRSGYTLSNMMGNAIPINIDPDNGELRINPDKVGQFVVGILVKEYREGRLIGEIHRDYQFNVSECVFDVQAFFTSPDRICHDTADFKNLSSAESKYHWDFGQQTTLADTSSQRDVSWYYGQIGKYKVTLEVEKNECRDTFYNYVWFVQPDSIHARMNVTPKSACDRLKVNITNNSDPTGYWSWNMGDGSTDLVNANRNEYVYNSPGVYSISLLIVDSLKCNISDLITDTIRVFQSPKAAFTLDTVMCDGVTLFENFSLGYDTLKWFIDDLPEVVSKENPKITFAKSGNYKIKLIAEKNGCFDTFNQKFSIVVHDKVNADLTANPLDGCSPLLVNFSASVAKLAKTFFDLGDGTVLINQMVNSHVYETPGDYQILFVISDSLSCNLTDTSEFEITVRRMPKADFVATTDHCTGKLTLENKSEFTSQTIWDFGDGNNSQQKMPDHTYSKDGEYQIVLISDKDSLCSDTVSKTVKVEINSLDKLDLYNVFTPDKHDNINHFFRTSGLDGSCFEVEMWIYNRWGELVYKNTNREPDLAGWDGKKESGDDFPEGSYFVIYNFSNKISGEKVSVSGTVTLIRGEE